MKRSILKQSLKQLWGIIVLEYKYHDRLPNIENYQSINQYSLPFEGKWTVVNGGVTDILAPADGVVAEIGTGNPDSRITEKRTVSCDAEDIRGNYILIEHTGQEYSLLAHLQPESILVTEGQRVQRGEKIARCGNSGNTTEPHLHFHIQQGKSFYNSPGLPVQFRDIIVAKARNYENFDDRNLDEEGEKYFPPYIFVGHVVDNSGISGGE